MKTKKRLLSILLGLVMVLGLMSGMSLTAWAAEKTGEISFNGLQVGDVITTVTNITDYAEYTVTLTANTHVGGSGTVNTDTILSKPPGSAYTYNVDNGPRFAYQFFNGSPSLSYWPRDDKGNNTKQWHVTAVDHTNKTITLAGYVPHTHSFTYSASGATITATCGANGCTLSPSTQGGSDHVATLTIAAPTLTYVGQSGDGISSAATLTGLDAFKSATGLTITATDIKYVGRDGTTYDESTTAPTAEGKYTAKLTLSGVKTSAGDNQSVTASVDYEIATKYPLWVGNTQVTSANAANITGSTPATASYDPETKTLTLDEFSSSTTRNFAPQGAQWSAYAVIYSDDSLNINLVGDNTITANGDGGSSFYGISLADNNTLTVDGTGSLTVKASTDAISSGRSSIRIKGGTLSVEGGRYGINCGNSSTAEGSESIIISGGNITTKGADNGLASSGIISITGGTLYAQATNTSNKAISGSGGGAIRIASDIDGHQSKDGTDWESISLNGDQQIYPGCYTIGSEYPIAKFEKKSSPSPSPSPSPSGGGSSDPTPQPSGSTFTGKVEGSGDNTESATISATIENGTATIAEVTPTEITKVAEATTAGQTTSLVLDVSGAPASVTSIEIPKSTVENIAAAAGDDSSAINGTTIKLPTGDIELDATATQAINKQAQGDSVKIEIAQTKLEELTAAQQETLKNVNLSDAKVVGVSVTSGSSAISDFSGGKARVSFADKTPQGKNPDYYHMYFLSTAGTLTRMLTTHMDDIVQFMTGHNSEYVLVYDETDLNENVPPISGAVVENLIYAGTEQAVKVSSVTADAVELKDTILPADAYTLSGDVKVKDVGTYKVVITAKDGGGYRGSTEVTYEVKKADQKMSVEAKDVKAKRGKKIKPEKVFTIENAVGKVKYTKVEGDKKIKISDSGKIKIKKNLKKGKYTVTVLVSSEGDGNYDGAEQTVEFVIKVK